MGGNREKPLFRPPARPQVLELDETGSAPRCQNSNLEQAVRAPTPVSTPGIDSWRMPSYSTNGQPEMCCSRSPKPTNGDLKTSHMAGTSIHGRRTPGQVDDLLDPCPSKLDVPQLPQHILALLAFQGRAVSGPNSAKVSATIRLSDWVAARLGQVLLSQGCALAPSTVGCEFVHRHGGLRKMRWTLARALESRGLAGLFLVLHQLA